MSDTPMKDFEELSEAEQAELNNPDLDLITDYVAGELDPAQVEAVARRLEEDAKFREFAAPILVAWGVAPHWQRFPMERAEIEAHWDEFTRRAGFAHQRRKTRRRRLWLLSVILLVLALPAFLYRSDIRGAWRDFRDYETVPADTGWITLRDSNQVRLAPGAQLRATKRTVEGVQRVRLTGSARFRVFPPDTTGPPMIRPLAVHTRAGLAFSGIGEFTVTTRGDTTEVEVHHPSRRRYFGFLAMPTTVLVSTGPNATPISLGETQSARLVRGIGVERAKR
jgi:ferric-dicitrate binding protein FerR (iron transport regulator)